MKIVDLFKLPGLVIAALLIAFGVACGMIAFPQETLAFAPFAALAFGTVYSESNYLGDVVLDELNKNASREAGTVITGQNLAIGAVVGKITASGKLTILNPVAGDGSQTAYGVMAQAVDATAADKSGVVIFQIATLKDAGLVWPGGITAPQKTTALNDLRAKHIIVRAAA